jgi:uncharacterized membrane protein YgdD (TMEM256/DUF423 family)
MSPQTLIITASILGALSVGLGAFGAHALENTLTPERMATWETAVTYHMWHNLALLLVAVLAKQFELNLDWVGYSFLAGIIIFSGSLYLLCLTNTSWLGAITPIGGICLIAGWLLLAKNFISSLN